MVVITWNVAMISLPAAANTYFISTVKLSRYLANSAFFHFSNDFCTQTLRSLLPDWSSPYTENNTYTTILQAHMQTMNVIATTVLVLWLVGSRPWIYVQILSFVTKDTGTFHNLRIHWGQKLCTVLLLNQEWGNWNRKCFCQLLPLAGLLCNSADASAWQNRRPSKVQIPPTTCHCLIPAQKTLQCFQQWSLTSLLPPPLLQPF